MEYYLNELNWQEFEELVIAICRDLLGAGISRFTQAADGGRETFFKGTASKYPALNDPWKGHFWVQAKHSGNPVASCSDSDFEAEMNKEVIKVRNPYLLFEEDVVKWPEFLDKLRKPLTPYNVKILEFLTNDCRNLLMNWSFPKKMTGNEKRKILDNLNVLIQRDDCVKDIDLGFIIESEEYRFKNWKNPERLSPSELLEFNRILIDSIFGEEIKKSEEKEDPVDHYLLFTNRKLTSSGEGKIRNIFNSKSHVKNFSFHGKEWIEEELSNNTALEPIMKRLGLGCYRSPLRICSSDIKEVILAFRNHKNEISNEFASANDFKYVFIEEKNRLNKLSDEYFNNVIRTHEQHFREIKAFLENPRNLEFVNYYLNICDEINAKITIHRNQFNEFENIFENLYDLINEKEKDLKIDRRFVNVFLHYMYCVCDIGKKQ